MSMIPDQIHRADKQTLQLIFHVDHLVGVWRHLHDNVNVAVAGRSCLAVEPKMPMRMTPYWVVRSSLWLRSVASTASRLIKFAPVARQGAHESLVLFATCLSV